MAYNRWWHGLGYFKYSCICDCPFKPACGCSQQKLSCKKVQDLVCPCVCKILSIKSRWFEIALKEKESKISAHEISLVRDSLAGKRMQLVSIFTYYIFPVLQSVSSIDTGRIVASVNASLQSSLASMSLVTSLSEQVADIMTRLQALSADIRAKVEESDAADVINVQSAQDRDAAIAAVDRVRVALENLNPSDPSRLEEVREFIEDVSVQYENADLSGVYQTLEERLQEQRRTREGLEAELESLSGDIQRLRQVSSVLPTGCNGET